MARIILTGGQRPPPTFAASRQRRDLIIAQPRWGFPKGRGRNPSPFGRFKERGFLRGEGNRNPSPLKWRFWLLLSLLTKVTRRRQKKKEKSPGGVPQGHSFRFAPQRRVVRPYALSAGHTPQQTKKNRPPAVLFRLSHSLSSLRTAMNASVGTCTVPRLRIFFLPSFCFSSSFFFRVMSPP